MAHKDKAAEGEFLWLMSLSDLMILLFVFFVVLFSFSYKRMKQKDFAQINAILNNKDVPKTAIDDVGASLRSKLKEMQMSDQVTIDIEDDQLTMQIRDTILFGSGQFDMKTEAESLIRVVGNAIEKVPPPYRIGIEGHTDDVPIHTNSIADNWELSTRRAHSLLSSLSLSDAALKRIVIMGYAEMMPLLPNRNPAGEAIPENQAKNRRVTIRIF